MSKKSTGGLNLSSRELEGFHNLDLQRAQARLVKGQSFKDLSTVCIIATRGVVTAKVLQSWFAMMTPMNQKFIRIFAQGFEVGDAYSSMIEQIIANKELAKWKYVLTLEEDNMPPPDGLLKLYEAIEGGVDGVKYGAVGALYWTKGELGQPMIYGNPDEMPLNFVPQLPMVDTVQRCNGLGMGFTLFRMSMLRDERLPKPLFKTKQEFIPNQGSSMYTQDLYFFQNAGAYYKFACDTRVRVGHYDADQDRVW